MKRAALVLAMSAPLIAGPVTLAWADTVPAPPGDSSAVAAQVDGVVTISGTSAHAGPDGSTASADVLDLGGQTVIGGSSSGGSKSGSVFDTGATPLGWAAIAPWSATAGSGSASGDAAVARASVVDDKTAHVDVLQSSSTASYSSAASNGHSSSDGAVVDLGDGSLRVLLLHSEADSSGKGSSYLVSVNGQQIGSSDQANGACVLSVPSLLDLTCLTASGGAGAGGVTTSSASVADAVLAGGSLPGVTAIGATGKGGAAPTGTPSAVTGSGGGAATGAPSGGSTGAGAAPAGGSLPFTGFDGARLAGLAGVLMAAGAWLASVRRRAGGSGAIA